jgi:hypothetical protein
MYIYIYEVDEIPQWNFKHLMSIISSTHRTKAKNFWFYNYGNKLEKKNK